MSLFYILIFIRNKMNEIFSHEYALYRIVVAGLTNDKYLKEAYTSEELYKYFLTECKNPITPETINVVKKVWLDNGGVV